MSCSPAGSVVPADVLRQHSMRLKLEEEAALQAILRQVRGRRTLRDTHPCHPQRTATLTAVATATLTAVGLSAVCVSVYVAEQKEAENAALAKHVADLTAQAQEMAGVIQALAETVTSVRCALASTGNPTPLACHDNNRTGFV